MSLFWPKSGACCCTPGTPGCYCVVGPETIYLHACYSQLIDLALAEDAGDSTEYLFVDDVLRWVPVPAAFAAILAPHTHMYLGDTLYPASHAWSETKASDTRRPWRWWLRCDTSPPGKYDAFQIWEVSPITGSGPAINSCHTWPMNRTGNTCSPWRAMRGTALVNTSASNPQRIVTNGSEVMLSAVSGDHECGTAQIDIDTPSSPGGCLLPGVVISIPGATPSSGVTDAAGRFACTVPNTANGSYPWTATLSPYTGTSGTAVISGNTFGNPRTTYVGPTGSAMTLPAGRFQYFAHSIDVIPSTLSITFNNHARFGSLGGTTQSLARFGTTGGIWLSCYPYTGGTSGNGGGSVFIIFSPDTSCTARPTAAVTFRHQPVSCAGSPTTTATFSTITGTTVGPIAFVATAPGGEQITVSG